jgi:predicted NBD/HSP70 family sugar kinase
LRPGLGLSAFVGGKLHPGVHGAAGEIALLPVIAEQDLDELVRRAARQPGEQLLLDEAASSNGVVRLAHRLGLDGVRSARHVYRAARDGDATAVRVLRAHTKQLALAVTAAAGVLDPELIVVSGYLDEPVSGDLRQVLRALDANGPELVSGHLGEEAVLLGAVAAGLPAAHERVFARSLDTVAS